MNLRKNRTQISAISTINIAAQWMAGTQGDWVHVRVIGVGVSLAADIDRAELVARRQLGLAAPLHNARMVQHNGCARVGLFKNRARKVYSDAWGSNIANGAMSGEHRT